jgi:glycosyltransferase involved in cell wall biosynthesis
MLAQEVSAKALAETIIEFFEKDVKSNPEAIRAYAKAHFSFKEQALAYSDIYKSITKEETT